MRAGMRRIEGRGGRAPIVWGRSLAAAALVLLGACTRQAVGTEMSVPGGPPAPVLGPAGGTVGAASGRAAVDAFLAAVNRQDLQAMSSLWGTTDGLARDKFKRDELEKRLIVMQCLIQHEKMRYVEDGPRLSTGGRQDYLVELTKGEAKAITSFTTVAMRSGRWVVETVDVDKLRDFCR